MVFVDGVDGVVVFVGGGGEMINGFLRRKIEVIPVLVTFNEVNCVCELLKRSKLLPL